VTPAELIAAYRQAAPTEALPATTSPFSFQPGPVEYGYPTDVHLAFRTEVVEALLPDFSLADIGLIRAVFREEMACEAAIQQHENLYQLCFYLYELGQLEDSFRLYEAKFLAKNMDVGVTLDREMMTVRHEVATVVGYVEAVFRQQPALQTRYPTILHELDELVMHPDYTPVEAYHTYIRGYFYGHGEGVSATESTATMPEPVREPSGYQPRPKPWWKFW
jgi:hypothetical protein